MAQPASLNQDLTFPPVFEPVAAGSGDAFARAVEEAGAGRGAGTLVWAQRLDLFDTAVVLEPDRPLAEAWPAVLVAGLAIGDALGALGPPYKPVTYGWPNLVAVDGGRVGFIAAAAPAGAQRESLPDWLVVGVKLRMRYPDAVDQPGRRPDETALHEEGFGEVESPQLAESFARHFLHWVNIWLEDGLERIANHWLERLPEEVRAGEVRHGLDPRTGDLLLLRPGVTKPERKSLAEALAAPEPPMQLP